jgi:hypothetical protein
MQQEIDTFLQNPDYAPIPEVLSKFYTREQLLEYITMDILYHFTYRKTTTIDVRAEHRTRLSQLGRINHEDKSPESIINIFSYMLEINGRGLRPFIALATRINLHNFIRDVRNECAREQLKAIYNRLFPGELNVW